MQISRYAAIYINLGRCNRGAADIVRQILNGSADIAKLFTGSWISTQTVVAMRTDVAAAAVRKAYKRGRLVFTHPSNVAGLEVGLSAHMDVLAHAIEDTRGLTADYLRRMIAQKMTLIPTLHLFAQDYNIEAIRQQVRSFSRPVVRFCSAPLWGLN